MESREFGTLLDRLLDLDRCPTVAVRALFGPLRTYGRCAVSPLVLIDSCLESGRPRQSFQAVITGVGGAESLDLASRRTKYCTTLLTGFGMRHATSLPS
jgi:hypothetical protein